jgi:integrase
MAIYPDKKDGKLTGRFRVEVQLGTARLRGRFSTLAEAKSKEVEFRRQLAAGDTAGATAREDNRGAPKTVLQLLDKAAPFVFKDGSEHAANVDRIVRRFADFVGDIRLIELKTDHVDTFILKLRDAGLAPGTINRNLSALRRVLVWGTPAKGRPYIPELPTFEWQDEDEGRIRWVTREEEAELLRLLRSWGRDDIADYVVAAIHTGCRRGELLTAQPEQVDGKWLRLWETKNGEPRSVPLTPEAQAILQARLPWSFGKAQLRYWWDRARAEMGLEGDEDFVVHALRHTTATRLVERGVNLRVVQQFMGHKAIQTTLRYAHVSDELLATAALALSSHVDFIQVRKPVGVEEAGDRSPTASPVLGKRAVEAA